MNDRYLFKAKRVDNGEWVKGMPLFYQDGSMTIYGQKQAQTVGFHVQNNGYCDRNTICQCTGLKDKNGKLIWENDIVTGWFDDKIINGYIMYGSNATFFIERKGLYGIHLDNSEDWLEVIGNIFDNPELLGVGL